MNNSNHFLQASNMKLKRISQTWLTQQTWQRWLMELTIGDTWHMFLYVHMFVQYTWIWQVAIGGYIWWKWRVVSSEWPSVWVVEKTLATAHVSEVLRAHIHTRRKTLSPRTLTCSHTSHVPRCEKDGKAPPAKSLPKLPEGSFNVLSEWRSLSWLRRACRTLLVTRLCWKSYSVKGSKWPCS